MHTPKRAIIINSPHSGRSAQLSEAIAHLQQSGIEVVNTITIAALDNLPPQGTTWKESGIDVAVAAGGDRFVGGVITHNSASGLPLGILAPRTSNDIARSLPRSQEIQSA